MSQQKNKHIHGHSDFQHKRKKQKTKGSQQKTFLTPTGQDEISTYEDQLPQTPKDNENDTNESMETSAQIMSSAESIRYSQNLTVDSQFGPDIKKVVIKSNDKIKQRLNQIFRWLDDKEKNSSTFDDNGYELLLISRNDGIAKMVTITEIIKQKMNNLRKKSSKEIEINQGVNGQISNELAPVKIKNDRLATYESQKMVKVGKDEVTSLSGCDYKQFNYLDFVSIQKSELKSRKKNNTDILQPVQHTTNTGGSINFTKEHIDLLKIDKTIQLPVLYTYFSFSPLNSGLSAKLLKRFENLIKDGWSVQEE
ncbi:unnamed protein product [Ambrosiozyma monospora]|uniref:Unnamed protein product n=1 Tax=Ambrosiozyma monospora TaxID=43982 RepID=A0A9W6YW25_AMBMO|nr:unnamed protein product [Ambrosiozyma monospora]